MIPESQVGYYRAVYKEIIEHLRAERPKASLESDREQLVNYAIANVIYDQVIESLQRLAYQPENPPQIGYLDTNYSEKEQ